MNEDRYRRWSSYLKERFGKRVHKVSLDTGAGCPNRQGLSDGGCIFCDALGGGSGAFLQGFSLEQQVFRGIEGVRKRYGTDHVLLYLQGYSATNVSPAVFEETLQRALSVARESATVVGVAVGTRPDLVPEPVLKHLEALTREGLEVWLELGVQSTYAPSLEWLRRGHDLDSVWRALEGSLSRGLLVCCHLIAGIPEEPPRQLARSARELVDRGVQALKFHPLHVLAGTPLERLYREGIFVPATLESYLDEVVFALRHLPAETIIQRLSASAHPSRLVAPEWVAERNLFRNHFERYMEGKDVRQGDRYSYPMTDLKG